MDHPMMGKPTQTTKERATGNYIRPASPLPNAQQHSVERRRQTGTQEGKREQQDERGAPAARRDHGGHQMTRRSWFAQRPPTVRHPLQRRRPFSLLAHPFRLAAPSCPPGSLSASSFQLNAVGRLAGARLAGCSFPFFGVLSRFSHHWMVHAIYGLCVGILPLSDSVIRCND